MDGKAMLAEFEHESVATRKHLERVPFEKADWKPHEKSFSLMELAAHLANIPSWTAMTVEQDEFDLGSGWKPFVPTSSEELLAHFDEQAARAKESLAKVSAEELGRTWSLKQGDEVFFSMPKGAVLRSFVLNHTVHHRAQLGVYLRILDVPVPASYGPSADEE